MDRGEATSHCLSHPPLRDAREGEKWIWDEIVDALE